MWNVDGILNISVLSKDRFIYAGSLSPFTYTVYTALFVGIDIYLTCPKSRESSNCTSQDWIETPLRDIQIANSANTTRAIVHRVNKLEIIDDNCCNAKQISSNYIYQIL